MASTVASAFPLADNSSAGEVSLLRLYVLRAAYALLLVGLGALIVPDIVSHRLIDRGVIASLLGCVWLLAFIGLRYPLQMLPLLMFELGWKAIWMIAYGLPQYWAGQFPPTFAEDFFNIAFGVLLMPLVIPWPYVWRHYVKAAGRALALMNGGIHQGIMWIHIAGGMVALASGTVAVAARKGGPLHAGAGTWFFAAMLVLSVTASILEPFRSPPGSPIGGIMVCYFVATSWVAARRRDGRTGRFEILACLAALGLAAAMIWGGFIGATTPAGSGPVFALGGLCLLAGLLDLNAILRAKLSVAQRIARHLWRMCFAFFIATGSFFLGQQDVLPQAVRGSPLLFALAFAPFAVMLFWLVRLRFAKPVGLPTLRKPLRS